MKRYPYLAAAFVAATVLAGCSSMPAADSPLVLARSEFSAAQSSPQVSQFAAGELRQAGESLERANAASAKREKDSVVDHLAYVTRQQVAIARETAAQKASEQSVATANAERDRVRLAARTREADVAIGNAAAAQRSADASQRNAEASQRSAAASQRRSEDSQRQSEASQRQSEESLRQSRESQAGAEAAQRDSEASLRLAAAERQAANEAQMSAQAARAQTQDAEARARQLEMMLKELEAKKTDRGMVVTLGDVLFDTNEARLRPNGMRNLLRLADFFKQYPKRNVLIEGFTDSTGTTGGNRELSVDRAASVRMALLGMGVGPERITSKGYGESYPVAGNDTAAGRQLNRRVEMVVSDDNGAIAPR